MGNFTSVDSLLPKADAASGPSMFSDQWFGDAWDSTKGYAKDKWSDMSKYSEENPEMMYALGSELERGFGEKGRSETAIADALVSPFTKQKVSGTLPESPSLAGTMYSANLAKEKRESDKLRESREESRYQDMLPILQYVREFSKIKSDELAKNKG